MGGTLSNKSDLKVNILFKSTETIRLITDGEKGLRGGNMKYVGGWGGGGDYIPAATLSPS